jgi:hypothetical protein
MEDIHNLAHVCTDEARLLEAFDSRFGISRGIIRVHKKMTLCQLAEHEYAQTGSC